MSDKSLLKLGEIYGNILNTVAVVPIHEETKIVKKISYKMGKNDGPGSKELNDVGEKKSIMGNEDSSGPANADNYEQPEADTKNKKAVSTNLQNINNLSYEEDEENIGKGVNETINKFMANKSIFDKLFEAVMSDDSSDELNELGINPEGDSENPFAGEGEGDAEGEMGEEEVTITLSKDLAKKLHELLSQVVSDEGLEGEDDMGMEGEGDMGGDEGGSEGSNPFGEEDEETMGGVDVRKNSVDTGKNNKVGTTTGSPAAAAGDGSWTTGDGSMKPLPKNYNDGKNNKVAASKIKPGSFANK